MKKSHAEKNLDAIKTDMDKLNTIFQAAAQEMYSQGGNGGDAGQSQGAGSAGDGEVTDVDFEEVKDEKK